MKRTKQANVPLSLTIQRYRQMARHASGDMKALIHNAHMFFTILAANDSEGE